MVNETVTTRAPARRRQGDQCRGQSSSGWRCVGGPASSAPARRAARHPPNIADQYTVWPILALGNKRTRPMTSRRVCRRNECLGRDQLSAAAAVRPSSAPSPAQQSVPVNRCIAAFRRSFRNWRGKTRKIRRTKLFGQGNMCQYNGTSSLPQLFRDRVRPSFFNDQVPIIGRVRDQRHISVRDTVDVGLLDTVEARRTGLRRFAVLVTSIRWRGTPHRSRERLGSAAFFIQLLGFFGVLGFRHLQRFWIRRVGT